MSTWVKGHRKALVGYAGVVLTALSLALPGNQWVAVVISAATALGVHTIRNS